MGKRKKKDHSWCDKNVIAGGTFKPSVAGKAHFFFSVLSVIAG